MFCCEVAYYEPAPYRKGVICLFFQCNISLTVCRFNLNCFAFQHQFQCSLEAGSEGHTFCTIDRQFIENVQQQKKAGFQICIYTHYRSNRLGSVRFPFLLTKAAFFFYQTYSKKNICIFEGSCDTEEWSSVAENSALHHMNKLQCKIYIFFSNKFFSITFEM